MARRLGVVGALLAGALAVSGCSGATVSTASAQDPATAGGEVTLLSTAAIATLDPQRISDPTIAALTGRTLHRTLTAYAPTADGATQATVVGDLATDTGKPSEDLKTWRFTLRDDATWQDGSAVTCEDVKHGVARTFATDVVTGGGTDALAVLAIPRSPDGRSTYLGPYVTTPESEAGRAAFDQAVSCDGATVTFVLGEPTSDFNEMVTLPGFAPVQKATDPGAAGGPLTSNGPYQVQDSWDAKAGGLLVRNPKWTAESDPVRKALPDRIRVVTSQESATIMARVLEDGDEAKTAVSLTPAPPALQQQIQAVDTLRARSLSVPTGVVDHLVPSMASPSMGNPAVRAALAAATNREGYAVAIAGRSSIRPHASVIPSTLLARAAHGVSVQGADPAKARELLTGAGQTLPVPIRVAYRPGVAADKAMAALVAGWRAGGFEPTLVPVEQSYFATIAAPGAAANHDVFWSNWAPAWGSASTVLPPLFDSSLNITAAGAGRDYGLWTNPDWNARIRTIGATADRMAREKAWAEADDVLLADHAYVALAERSAVHLVGSDVRGLRPMPYGGGMVDLAVLGVDS